MRQDFLRAVLPTQGVYCAVAIERNSPRAHQRFFTSLDELNTLLDDHLDVNVYVTPNSFRDNSRLSAHAAWSRSFFVDLDVGPEKPYKTKPEALDSLLKFIDKTGLPPPIIIDSGGGLHAYWPFDIDVPIHEWRPYAQLFKQFCINNDLHIDAAITADAARIMRCPDTLNYKTDPPNRASVLSELVEGYDFNAFKEFLGDPPPDVETLLAGVERGVDEESAAVRGFSNYESNFALIAQKSLGLIPDQVGCAQIAYIINQPNKVSYNLWFAGLSVAARCDDGETAIHEMSEDYFGYSPENTKFKAAETLKATGPHKCRQFNEINPGLCDACPHWREITTPIELGRKFAAALTLSKETPGTTLALVTNGSGVPIFPESLTPFVRGRNGGVVMVLPPDGNDDGPPPAITILPYDLVPVKRIYSAKHGICLVMNYHTPHDGIIEFFVNISDLFGIEKFASLVMFHGVVPDRNNMKYLMDYVGRWFQYMQNLKNAEGMQSQMGFTEDRTGFIIGNVEHRYDGTERPAASSAYVKGLAKLLVPCGDPTDWRRAADYLDAPSMELHAFAMMCAFGSPLMHLTSVSGVCVSFYGPTGVAKTGALYSCLGVYGNPKELSVYNATDNAAVQRMLTLHSIPYGRDEATNMNSESLSNLIHTISTGKTKIRMQSSADAERELERSASMIALFTSNHSLEAKLETSKADPQGEMARTVEFFIEQKPALFAADPALSTFIFDTFRKSYGHAGPLYIKEVFKIGFEHVTESINKWIARFRASFGHDSAYRYYENLIGSTFAGTKIAIDAGIIKLDLERVYDIIMRRIISMRDDVPLNNFNYESLIGEYLLKNTQNTLIIDGARVIVEPKGELKVRVDISNGTQTVPCADFKRHLSTLQISPREFLSRVKQQNLLTTTDRLRLGKGWRNGNISPLVRVYEFKIDADPIVQALINAPTQH